MSGPLSAETLTWLRAAPKYDLDALCESGDEYVRMAALEERAARAVRDARETDVPPASLGVRHFEGIRCACGTSPCTCPKPEWDARPPRILAVFHGPHGHVLDYQGGAVFEEIQNVGEREMLQSLTGSGAPGDGVWVCDCELVPNGRNDWDSRTEWALDGTWREVAAGEWERFCEGVETTWGDQG